MECESKKKADKMPDENFLEKKEENITIHIFSVSAR